MKFRYFLLVCVFVALTAASASGHPDCFDGKVSEAISEMERSKGDTEELLKYYFELFTKVVYEVPMANQYELMELCKQLDLYFQPWSDKSKLNYLPDECCKAYEKLKEYLPVISLEWEEGKLVVPEIKPFDLTYSLPKHILLGVHNHTDEKLNINAASMKTVHPPHTGVVVNKDQTRMLLVSLVAGFSDTFSSVDVHLSSVADKPQTHVITIPVKLKQPAIIKGKIYDQQSGDMFPGRVYVNGSDNIYRFDKALIDNQTVSEKPIVRHIGIGKSYRLPFFYSDGTFEVIVPEGETQVTLERGYEHKIISKTIKVKAGQTKEVKISSGRIVDMKKRGWISGDTHVHWVKNWWSQDEDIKLLSTVQRAEDLRVVNNLTLLQYRPDEQGGAFIAPAQYPMGPVTEYSDGEYHIQMAQEYRNDNLYGHLCFLNIKELIYPISTGQGSGGPAGAYEYPLNKTAIDNCHRQGGISTEAHNLGPFNRSDVSLNAVNGWSDAFDQMIPENYYRFMDCGFQIPLGNGSDHPARLAGEPRMYVKVEGEFSYQKWIDGVRAKSTFVSSGPLIFLKVNGKDIGSEIHVTKGSTLTVEAEVYSRHRIGNFQIVSNHEVIADEYIDGTRGKLKIKVPADMGRWFAARCSQNDKFYAMENINVAHTSGIYVFVDGEGPFDANAARYWVEVLKAHYKNVSKNAKFANDGQRQQQLDHIQSGIDKYEDLIRKYSK